MALNDVTFPVATPAAPDQTLPSAPAANAPKRSERSPFLTRLQTKANRPSPGDRSRPDRSAPRPSSSSSDSQKAAAKGPSSDARPVRDDKPAVDTRDDVNATSPAPVLDANDPSAVPQPAAQTSAATQPVPVATEPEPSAAVEVEAYVVQAIQGAPPSGVAWSGLEANSSNDQKSDSSGGGLNAALQKMLEELIKSGTVEDEDDKKDSDEQETKVDPEAIDASASTDEDDEEKSAPSGPVDATQAFAAAMTDLMNAVVHDETNAAQCAQPAADSVADGAQDATVRIDPTAVTTAALAADQDDVPAPTDNRRASFTVPATNVAAADDATDDVPAVAEIDVRTGPKEDDAQPRRTTTQPARHAGKSAKRGDEVIAGQPLPEVGLAAATAVSLPPSTAPAIAGMNLAQKEDGLSSIAAVGGPDDSIAVGTQTPSHVHDAVRDIPTPLADSTPRVGQGEFADRLARAIDSQRPNGELAVRLNPPSLGAMRIEVTMRDGALSARLSVESPQAQQLLHETLPQLRESLAKMGASVERIDVHLAPQRTEAAGSSDQPRGESQRESSDSQQGFAGDRNDRGGQQSERREQQATQNMGGDESADEKPAGRSARGNTLGIDRIDLVM